MDPTSWIEVDLERLRSNVAAWRGALGNSRLCAVVKADGYGLGAQTIAGELERLRVDMLAVFSPAQACELIDAGLTTPILILMPVHDVSAGSPLERALVKSRLHLSIHDADQLKPLDAACRRVGAVAPVHLYLDTGMSRAGLSDSDFACVLERLDAHKHLRLAGAYTHFASAGDDLAFLDEQEGRFARVCNGRGPLSRGLGSVLLHTANTAAAARGRKYHHDMARIGLGLHGYAPLAGLAHTVRWLSRIAHIQRFPKGAPVGYNSTHRLRRDSVLGIVPAGYGDGYPLALSNKGCVGVNGHAAPVLGRVNMDQIVVDLTDLHRDFVAVGTHVELISNDPASPCSLPRLASLADSHEYEMLCRLSPRIKRIYR